MTQQRMGPFIGRVPFSDNTKRSGVASSKFRGERAKLHKLAQWRPQDSAKRKGTIGGLGALPQPPRVFRVFARKTLSLA